jgi:EmrB/QacA subfamily drug resistance transporter
MTRSRGTLLVVCLATAMLMLDIAVVNTALAHIARDLHSGLAGVQWIVDAYTLALSSVVLTCGALADRYGRRRVFAAGIVLFTTASLACALAGTIAVLDGARAVQGIGAALMFAPSLALLAEAFPGQRERAGALAAYGAAIGASFAFGPLLGGALTSVFGWRSVFVINVPLGLMALALSAFRVEESRDGSVRRVDLPGQLALAGGLFLLVLSLLRGNVAGWGSAQIVLELCGAAGLLTAFTAIELRTTEPMLALSLFRRGPFAGAQVAAFAVSASFFAIYLYLTLYLQDVLGLSALQTGLVYLPSTLLVFIVSGATAQIPRGLPAGLLIGGGLMLVAAGMAMMTLLAADSSWTAILPGELLCGLGCGVLNPALSSVALTSAPARQSGVAAGTNDTFRQGGIAVGVAAFGALVPASGVLGHGGAGAFVGGLHTALWVGVAIAVVGAVASARLIGVRRSAAAQIAPAAGEQDQAETREAAMELV